MSNRLTLEQKKRNADSRGNWQRAASHRHQVTGLLRAACRHPSSAVAVLGAGNLNDVDLGQLLTSYNTVDLFDIDEVAVREGLRSQSIGTERVTVRAPYDLTCVWPLLASHAEAKRPSLEELLASIGDARPTIAERFDIVASTCVLSQLIDAVFMAFGSDDGPSLEVALAIRDAHLKLMADLLQPGGTGVLITDFVSTETAPSLTSLPPEELPNELRRMINAGNFFTGLNPAAIHKRLTELAAPLSITAASVAIQAPWLWDFGPRAYAVTAITFQKHPTPS